jgi:hypothetical protein
VIDLTTNTILYSSLVAHGEISGTRVCNQFFKYIQSFKSSLGFIPPVKSILEKHGKSLKLDGLKRYKMARERAVVIHGAKYVSNSFIQKIIAD